MSWEDICGGGCGRPIPSRGNHRRPVPSRGGKVAIVCADCARTIDEQATLVDESTGKTIGTRPRKTSERDEGRLDAQERRRRRAA
jgi:hypothetical protein